MLAIDCDVRCGRLLSATIIDEISDHLLKKGYYYACDIIDQQLVQDLQEQAQQIAASQWNKARIGRQVNLKFDDSIRSDTICWLSPSWSVEATYIQLMNSLIQAVNQKVFIGQFDYEAHFSSYDVGAYYKKHKDAFIGQKNRIISTVLYLNSGWKSADGGELVLYAENGEALEKIVPILGTFVIFLSEEILHEVLPTKRRRLSIAGWFKQKPLLV